jgi:hypothetical protein
MTTQSERVDVRVSEDRMTAEVMVFKASPEPSIFELRALLANKGVLFGLNDDCLKEALAAPGTWVAIAFGKLPREPVHGHVQYHFRSEKKPHVEIAADGKADLKELGLIENVAAGHILATLVDPVEGEIGRHVTGDPIHVEGARPGALLPGKNVSIAPNGRDLVAGINGRVILDKDGRVSVDDTYVVMGDVGPATGNIDFVGTVRVSGNVCADFRVKASERVEIAGHVEAAVIEAGKEITIKGGVSGAGRAILSSPGSITVKHAQDARIFAGGTLVVKESLMRVTAMAGQEIRVETGAIIGGVATAPVIHAAGLGSNAEARTVIEVGIAPRVRLMAGRLETQFITTRGELMKLRQRLIPLQAQHTAGKIMTPEDKTMMERLEPACLELEKRILLIAGEIETLVNSAAASVDGGLVITGEVHPGVILSSVKMERPVRHVLKGLTVTAHEGKLAGGEAKE